MKLSQSTLEIASESAHSISDFDALIDAIIKAIREGNILTFEFGYLLGRLLLNLLERVIDEANQGEDRIVADLSEDDLNLKLLELVSTMAGPDSDKVLAQFPKQGSLPFFYMMIFEFVLNWAIKNLDDKLPTIVIQAMILIRDYLASNVL